ncbi:MAG TPA: chorismate synthase [Candidatus Sumerlaeota bacterium]|nr:chorismate synthase [Candidatus Sumerlaeota bacterium]
MLEYMTAGESHGPQLTAIVNGFPAHVPVTAQGINRDLARRQAGYGRGERMKIEQDAVEILSGVRFGKTMGSPITLVVRNRDYENWSDIMSPEPAEPDRKRVVTHPRPGHADLPGCLLYGHHDARNILERASARETAARVAAGSLCRFFLHEMGAVVFSHVISIHDAAARTEGFTLDELRIRAEESDVRCADSNAAEDMRRRIDEARGRGDTIGGVVEIVATGIPLGLGDVMTSSERLDGRLAGALMNIQAVKGVEIGMGFRAACEWGSRVHDAIHYSTGAEIHTPGRGPSGGFYHATNNAGGIEGGITNGEPLIMRIAVKPIPTMMTPKMSADLVTKEPFEASKERSDVCAVPAAGVVAEAAVCFVLADAFLRRFGGRSLPEIRARYDAAVRDMQNY